MGYYATGNGSIRIRTADLDDAYRAAMTTLSEQPWFDSDTELIASEDMGELLTALFDDISPMHDVDITEYILSEINVKQGRWVNDTFDALAPFVLVGQVDWRGEDGDLWRFSFDSYNLVYQHAEFDDELMEQARVTLREIVEFAEDEHATCRECDGDLPADNPCPESEDGEHDADLDLSDPPEDEPTRQVTVQFKITVPNDGYDYHVDMSGRLEWLLSLMLLHPLITVVETSGSSGSGWITG